jgi:TolB-like protein
MSDATEPVRPMPPSAEPSAPSDPAKPPRKRAKVRKHWYSVAARVIAHVVGAAASVWLGLFLIQRSQPAGSPPTPVRAESTRTGGERAIAILPIDNFSKDPSEEYFADGMTEALTAELAQVEGLHVISRTSVMRYKEDRKPIPAIAQELDVDFVVEGSVVRADRRVRITAQLIDAKSDEHLWARSYDGTMSDILDLQATVARAIAA